MAVLAMKKVNICALKKDRKSILETLQRIGIVEVSNLDFEQKFFCKIDTMNMRSVFEKNSLITKEALEIIEKYAPEEASFFSGVCVPKEISKKEYYRFANGIEETMPVANEIVNLYRSINDKNAKITQINKQVELLIDWEKLDVPMNFASTKRTKAFIGTLPQNLDDLNLRELLSELLPDEDRYDLKILNKNDNQIFVFVLCHISVAEKIFEALRTLGFAWPIYITDEVPKIKINSFLEQINELEEQVKFDIEKIKSFKVKRDAIKFIADYYDIRSQKYEIISKLLHTKNVFLLSGFVPEKYAKKLERFLLSKFNITIEFDDPGKEDEIPVVLQNNGFSSPVEGVLESYSLPGKGDVDPTSVMAIFYYFLFGMMLSDAAYGLIIVAACSFVLLKYKNLKLGLKKALKMFLFCGISTTFWGFLFGSFFGDAIEVISTTFFNKPIIFPALWFVPLNEPMRMLAFSFGVGLAHIFTGLFLQLYELVRDKKFSYAFYDVVSWYFLIGGLVVYMLSVPMITEMLVTNFILPQFVGEIGLSFAGIGALLILFTAGRESKNPFKRFLKGVYGLYGVTGYLSDVLSYSRLLALGLATGVIAQVFNKMGTMAGNGPFGLILFLIVFLVGHTMNIAINLLGAYVHTNRLQFVEFFGKFYEGGGRKFSPFFADTKYYKIKEDICDE